MKMACQMTKQPVAAAGSSGKMACTETGYAIAAHESPRTTKLYDRTSDEVTLDEVERIRI